MKQIFSYRGINFLLVIATLVGMGFALYLQKYENLLPCPLCVFQRIGIMAMGAVACVAFIVNAKKTWLRHCFTLLSTLAIGWSVGVAARHVWLQHLPADQVPSCGPGLDYWLEALPLKQVLSEVLSGSGECAVVDWAFLGVSLPEWSLVFFSVLLLMNLSLFYYAKQKKGLTFF